MARTIDMTQVSSKGTERNPYTSIYAEVQGKAQVGDTILLRDGAFIVTHVGATWESKTGFTETHLSLKPAR